MAFAAAGHLLGTFMFYARKSDLFVWSMSGVLAAARLVALNILRNFRPHDRPIACIALAGSICWLVIVVLSGISAGSFLDPRVLIHLAAAAGLSFFGFRTASQPA